MQYITTTQLRTESSNVVKTLKEGSGLRLIHRSKIIGDIMPVNEPKPLTREDIELLKKTARELNLPKLSYKQREERYRAHLMKKYGKGLS